MADMEAARRAAKADMNSPEELAAQTIAWAWDLLECINGPEGCEGRVDYRMPLSGTGKSFPRCDRHWEQRLEHEEQLRERYPQHAPSDWSPDDAGEAWGEDDY